MSTTTQEETAGRRKSGARKIFSRIFPYVISKGCFPAAHFLFIICTLSFLPAARLLAAESKSEALSSDSQRLTAAEKALDDILDFNVPFSAETTHIYPLDFGKGETLTASHSITYDGTYAAFSEKNMARGVFFPPFGKGTGIVVGGLYGDECFDPSHEVHEARNLMNYHKVVKVVRKHLHNAVILPKSMTAAGCAVTYRMTVDGTEIDWVNGLGSGTNDVYADFDADGKLRVIEIVGPDSNGKTPKLKITLSYSPSAGVALPSFAMLINSNWHEMDDADFARHFGKICRSAQTPADTLEYNRENHGYQERFINSVILAGDKTKISKFNGDIQKSFGERFAGNTSREDYADVIRKYTFCYKYAFDYTDILGCAESLSGLGLGAWELDMLVGKCLSLAEISDSLDEAKSMIRDSVTDPRGFFGKPHAHGKLLFSPIARDILTALRDDGDPHKFHQALSAVLSDAIGTAKAKGNMP